MFYELKMSKVSSDALRYTLLNIIKRPIDPNHYTRQRIIAYKNIYHLYALNRHARPKAKNLYVLLYSKYSTQRFVLTNRGLDPAAASTEEDDEAIKTKFRNLLDEEIASAQEIEIRYLRVVEKLKTKAVYTHYAAFNERMNRNGGMNDDEDLKELFSIGTSETDIYLEKKLLADADRFLPMHERARNWLLKMDGSPHSARLK